MSLEITTVTTIRMDVLANKCRISVEKTLELIEEPLQPCGKDRENELKDPGACIIKPFTAVIYGF